MKYINKESADIEKEINKPMALIERTTTVNDISELREGLEDFVANYNLFQQLMVLLLPKVRH